MEYDPVRCQRMHEDQQAEIQSLHKTVVQLRDENGLLKKNDAQHRANAEHHRAVNARLQKENEDLKARMTEVEYKVTSLTDTVSALSARHVDKKEQQQAAAKGPRRARKAGMRKPKNPDKIVHLDDPHCQD